MERLSNYAWIDLIILWYFRFYVNRCDNMITLQYVNLHVNRSNSQHLQPKTWLSRKCWERRQQRILTHTPAIHEWSHTTAITLWSLSILAIFATAQRDTHACHTHRQLSSGRRYYSSHLTSTLTHTLTDFPSKNKTFFVIIIQLRNLLTRFD